MLLCDWLTALSIIEHHRRPRCPLVVFDWRKLNYLLGPDSSLWRATLSILAISNLLNCVVQTVDWFGMCWGLVYETSVIIIIGSKALTLHVLRSRDRIRSQWNFHVRIDYWIGASDVAPISLCAI